MHLDKNTLLVADNYRCSYFMLKISKVVLKPPEPSSVCYCVGADLRYMHMT